MIRRADATEAVTSSLVGLPISWAATFWLLPLFVLLQEGMGTPDSASFALWIAEHELVQQALGAQDAHMRPEAHGNAHGGEA